MDRTTPTPTLELFSEPMTLERAREIAKRYPVGTRLKFQTGARRCDRRWTAWVRLGPGEWRQLHVGSSAKKQEIERAWSVLDRERARLEEKLAERRAVVDASPEAEALRELVAAAYMSELSKPRRKPPARDVVDVPILRKRAG